METNTTDIRTLSQQGLQDWLQSEGQPNFRTKQIWEWLWQKGVRSMDEMTNLSKDLRQKMSEMYVLNALTVDRVQTSSDTTVKWRMRTYDGHFIESVLIPSDDRLTVCVSSQVGCSLSCKFCATGQIGRKRNLNFDEIFDQVVIVNATAMARFGRPLTNIVYMGMGEPLLNYSEVMKSIERISAEDGLGMSPRRITVSTAGISKMITKMGDDEVRFRLALSLHAATDEKRNRIMAINETNNLDSLVEALNHFNDKTGNRISFEYILFDGFNDTTDDAKELIKLCQRVPARVNIIEYNSVEGVPYQKSKKIGSFLYHLEAGGVSATVRRSRGKDIDAACGQLANK